MTELAALETKRAETEAKLNALRATPDPALAELVRKADAAVAVYKGEAAKLEGQLADIDREIGLRERDRREAAAREEEAQWLASRKALLEAEDRRLQTVADAEQAARALADAIGRAITVNAEMSALARELSADGKAPGALNPMELVNRLAMRIASVLATIPEHRHRLGPLAWPAGAASLYPSTQCWREDEERRMSRHLLQPLLDQGTRDDEKN